jgi:glycosyltransferase involved in cell wall biosynthesis
MKPIRVALICYAIEAGRGSEQGSGYNIGRLLAARPDIDLSLFTRRNNVDSLRRDPAFSNVALIGYDPPRLFTFWKSGSRGVIPYYYIWQRGIAKTVRNRGAFDVVHNYNFHTDWAPHFLDRNRSAVIWGPICHQPPLPRSYFAQLPWHRYLLDRAKWLTKNAFWRLDPNLRRAISHSDIILYANPDVAPPFRSASQVRLQTFGGSAWPAATLRPDSGEPITRFLHVGRSVEIKGAHIAVEAFAEFVRLGGRGHLTVIGDGPLREHIGQRVRHLNLDQEIDLIPWIPLSDVEQYYRESHALVYPSFGNQDTVVAEALSAGLPVVCIAGSGTAHMAGHAALTAPAGSNVSPSHSLAVVLIDLHRQRLANPEAYEQRRAVSMARAETVSWEGTARSIASIYYEVLREVG